MFFDSKLVELHGKIKTICQSWKKQFLAFLSQTLQMQSDFSLLLSEWVRLIKWLELDQNLQIPVLEL